MVKLLTFTIDEDAKLMSEILKLKLSNLNHNLSSSVETELITLIENDINSEYI